MNADLQTPELPPQPPCAVPSLKRSPNFAAIREELLRFLGENARVAAALLLLPTIFVTWPIFAGLLWQWTPDAKIDQMMMLADARLTYLCASGLGSMWLVAAAIIIAARTTFRVIVPR